MNQALEFVYTAKVIKIYISRYSAKGQNVDTGHAAGEKLFLK
jgi:hypothetical protein